MRRKLALSAGAGSAWGVRSDSLHVLSDCEHSKWRRKKLKTIIIICKLKFSPAFVYLGKVVAKMQGLYLGSNLFCALWSSNLGGNNVHQCTNEQEYAIMWQPLSSYFLCRYLLWDKLVKMPCHRCTNTLLHFLFCYYSLIQPSRHMKKGLWRRFTYYIFTMGDRFL